MDILKLMTFNMEQTKTREELQLMAEELEFNRFIRLCEFTGQSFNTPKEAMNAFKDFKRGAA